MNKSMNDIKAYWMATMAMSETREQMEEIWNTEEGKKDLVSWFNDECDAGLTEADMDEAIKAKEDIKMEGRKFVADGTTYEVNEKGNRFYKTIGTQKLRISKAEFDKAASTPTDIKIVPCEKGDHLVEFARIGFGYGVRVVGEEEFHPLSRSDIKNMADQRDGDMKFSPTFEFMGRRYWTKDATNGGSKGKKAKRAKKNVAFRKQVGDAEVTLTEKQVDFIKHIPDTDFYENGLESTMWVDVLTDQIGGQFENKPMTIGAMISTLREKDLIYVSVDRINGRKCKFFGFTDLGKKIAEALGLN